MTDVEGNSRFPAPAAYDQREREFVDGRPAGRAPPAGSAFPSVLPAGGVPGPITAGLNLAPARRPRSGLRAISSVRRVSPTQEGNDPLGTVLDQQPRAQLGYLPDEGG